MSESDMKLLGMGIQQQIPLMLNQSTQMNLLINTIHNLNVGILGQARIMSNLQLAFSRLADIIQILHNSIVVLTTNLIKSPALGIGKSTQTSIAKELGQNISRVVDIKNQMMGIKMINGEMTGTGGGMMQTRGIVDAIKNGVLATRGEIKGSEIGSNKDPSVNMLKAGKAMTGIGAQLGTQIPQMMMMMFVMKPIMDLLQGVLSVFEPLLELFGVFGEIIGTAFIPVVNQLMTFILPFIPFLVDLMQRIAPFIQILFNLMVPFEIVIGLFTHFDVVIRGFQWVITEFGKAFIEVGKAIMDAGAWIMGILNAIQNGFSVVLGEMAKAFETFVNWIKGIINFLLGWAFGGADRDIFTPV